MGHKIIFIVNISGHVEGVVSDKNIRCQHLCMYQDLSVCISRDFSSSLAIEMYGWPFIWCLPYIESTTALSNNPNWDTKEFL